MKLRDSITELEAENRRLHHEYDTATAKWWIAQAAQEKAERSLRIIKLRHKPTPGYVETGSGMSICDHCERPWPCPDYVEASR